MVRLRSRANQRKANSTVTVHSTSDAEHLTVVCRNKIISVDAVVVPEMPSRQIMSGRAQSYTKEFLFAVYSSNDSYSDMHLFVSVDLYF